MESFADTNATNTSGRTALVAGLSLAAVGCFVQHLTNDQFTPTGADWWGAVALMLSIAGIICAGYSVSLRPRSVLRLLVAALTCALTSGGIPHILEVGSIRAEWDSVRLATWLMAWVAVCAALVLMLPRRVQRLAVTLLIVFHFMGEFSAMTSPPPQPWLSSAAWTYVFRPHLVFCYANNAYQFYSPEPGPASLLWFCVEMKDGSKQWYKIPPRRPVSNLDPMAVEYYRLLSITNAATQTYNNGPSQQVLARRQQVLTIPHHPGVSITSEYRPLQEYTRRTLASYTRYVARLFDPALIDQPSSDQVKGIKVYRVLHDMLKPAEFARGADPFRATSYFPYFLGEYDTDGRLIDPNDPMLFWIIPIVPRDEPAIGPGRPDVFDNYLALHAGSDPFEDMGK